MYLLIKALGGVGIVENGSYNSSSYCIIGTNSLSNSSIREKCRDIRNYSWRGRNIFWKEKRNRQIAS
ncbi:MAG: hypothetical protein XD50_1657 [Clostridia bacterium 41_269]|nr:MAG: hypothetical protein XD50_1657 [Clostridia bacterium 41_269]